MTHFFLLFLQLDMAVWLGLCAVLRRRFGHQDGSPGRRGGNQKRWQVDGASEIVDWCVLGTWHHQKHKSGNSVRMATAKTCLLHTKTVYQLWFSMVRPNYWRKTMPNLVDSRQESCVYPGSKIKTQFHSLAIHQLIRMSMGMSGS